MLLKLKHGMGDMTNKPECKAREWTFRPQADGGGYIYSGDDYYPEEIGGYICVIEMDAYEKLKSKYNIALGVLRQNTKLLHDALSELERKDEGEK